MGQKFEFLTISSLYVPYISATAKNRGNAERMTMLRDKHVSFLHEHIPEYSSEQFRTARLEERLVNHFGEKINFWLPSRRCTSELVCLAELDTGEAVQTAFEATASENRVLAEAAAIQPQHGWSETGPLTALLPRDKDSHKVSCEPFQV